METGEIHRPSPPADWTSHRAVIAVVAVLLVGGIAALLLSSQGSSGDSQSPPAKGGEAAKAGDARAEETAHTAQIAIETFATENNGSYVTATPAALKSIEPTLVEGDYALSAMGAATYTITSIAHPGSDRFVIIRAPDGKISYSCSPAGAGNCPAGGDWGN